MRQRLETVSTILIMFAMYRYSERIFNFVELIFGKFFGIFDFIEHHFLSILCLLGALILGIMYMKESNDDELPSGKFKG